MGARVRYDPARYYYLEVVGHGELYFQDGELLVGTREVAGPAYLYSLRQALMREARCQHGGDMAPNVRLELSSVPEVYFDRDFGPYDWVSLLFEEGRPLVQVVVVHTSVPNADAVEQLLAPFLRRHKASCDSIDWVEQNDAYLLEVQVDWPTKGRTVADAWAFGSEVEALLQAADGGEITPATALDLLRGGQWDVFRGQPESEWLEAKGDPYNVAGPNWRFELAKDVAAFANSPNGGLIILGMTTRDEGDGDIIRGYKPFELKRVQRQAYRNHIAQRIYPRVAGFEVYRVEGSTKGEGIVALAIPPQPETSKPFLVQGVVTSGQVLGSHVLVPFRREDDTAALDAAAIHTRLRLGEQVIVGNQQRPSETH